MDDLISRQPEITKRNAETEHFVPNSDLISRKAAIDALESIGSIDTEADIEFAIEIFEALPSVQEWIPVTERLPEVSKRVLCQCRADNFEVLKLATDRSWIKDSTHIYMSGFVVAWMPLPEPYKGEK